MTESLIHGRTMPSEFARTMTEEKRLRYDKDNDKKTEPYHKAVFLKIFRDHKNTSYKISAY